VPLGASPQRSSTSSFRVLPLVRLCNRVQVLPMPRACCLKSALHATAIAIAATTAPTAPTLAPPSALRLHHHPRSPVRTSVPPLPPTHPGTHLAPFATHPHLLGAFAALRPGRALYLEVFTCASTATTRFDTILMVQESNPYRHGVGTDMVRSRPGGWVGQGGGGWGVGGGGVGGGPGVPTLLTSVQVLNSPAGVNAGPVPLHTSHPYPTQCPAHALSCSRHQHHNRLRPSPYCCAPPSIYSAALTMGALPPWEMPLRHPMRAYCCPTLSPSPLWWLRRDGRSQRRQRTCSSSRGE
jgi:hypothetical protein